MISTNNQDDLKLPAGDTDSYGAIVKVVYDRVDGKYIIYADSNDNLVCGDFGIQLKEIGPITSALLKIADLCAVSPGLGKKYISHRALGIRHWCRDEVEASTQALDDTFEMMHRTLTRRARLLYISGSFWTSLVLLAAATILTRYGTTQIKTWSLVWLFGALGAFVSANVQGHPTSLDVLEDSSATLKYGVVRAMVAIIFASLTYLSVLGGIILPDLAHESSSRLLVLAFVAGFSQKLVPEAVIHHAISGGSH